MKRVLARIDEMVALGAPVHASMKHRLEQLRQLQR
jgi:hypothetical protein